MSMELVDSPVLENTSFWFTQEYADMIHSKNSLSNISEDLPYYGSQFAQYHDFYATIHGYISVIVCIFGILASSMNIIVLTRKNMITPINIILTGLAFADMMVMLITVPFNIHYYLRKSLKDMDRYTYGWAVYEIVYNHIVLVYHTISIWLTVTVAIWRYMAVCHPTSTAHWRSLKRAKISVALIYVICHIFCIPLYLTYTVSKESAYTYYVSYSDIVNRNNFILTHINFWIFSVIIKLVPCIALSGISFFLIRALYKAKLRRKQLEVEHDSQEVFDRITRLLLVVLLLFMIAEFPHGMIALMGGILGEAFARNIYINLLETLEDIILVNCAVNFIIYCSMSGQFRDTFVSLFLIRWRKVNTKIRSKMHAMESVQKWKTTRF